MLMLVNDVAQMLGMNPRQVYYHCRNGNLPHIKLGRQVRFSRNQIERWLDGGGGSLSSRRSSDEEGGSHVD
jgi:excisionase family DNA binding protein